jgi:hypothetical protein
MHPEPVPETDLNRFKKLDWKKLFWIKNTTLALYIGKYPPTPPSGGRINIS